ncbi:MAG: hypothetical protein JXA13_17330 [Anaerolineales bacterium]|nr:hypothetical protein [Anaerolineales bacterium]
MTLPTFIPIQDAANKFGYDLPKMKELVESGKIDAVQLPDGDLIVSEGRLSSYGAPYIRQNNIFQKSKTHLEIFSSFR